MGRVGVTLTGFAAALLAVAIAAAPALGQLAQLGQPRQPGQPQQSGQLDPPSGLKATPVSGTEVDLSWSAPDGPPPSLYDVYQGTSPGGEAKTSLSSNDTSADVIGLSPGTTYYFEVTAVDDRGNESDLSNEAQATTQGGIIVATTAVSTAPVSPTPVSPTPVSPTPVSPPPVSPPPVSPGPPGPGGRLPSWRGFLPPVLVAGAAVGLVPVVRRRRRRRRAAPLASPASSPPAAGSAVRAVPRPGPQAAVTVRPTGPGGTQAVRFVPNPGTLITTIEKVQPR